MSRSRNTDSTKSLKGSGVGRAAGSAGRATPGLLPPGSADLFAHKVQRAAQTARTKEADDASDRQEDRTSPCVLSEEIPQRLRSSAFFSASHAARCVACQGVRSHPVPVALVGECSIPVV